MDVDYLEFEMLEAGSAIVDFKDFCSRAIVACIRNKTQTAVINIINLRIFI